MGSIVRHGVGKRFSKIVVHNGVAYLAGIASQDRTGDIVAQTRDVLNTADALFAEIGAMKSNILTAAVWLRDIREFDGMNVAWEAWIDQGHPPARATVEAKLAHPDLRVEVQFTVALEVPG